jgi:S-formylglutathione hydrolase
MKLSLEAENKTFGGHYQVHSHWGESTNCNMVFSIFLPPQLEVKKLPVLIWLSGLTCTEENFRIKAGVQRYATEAGIIVVSPDTSPRGEGVPDDPDYGFGQGASFYLDATQEPWSEHFNMYSYILKDLLSILESNFPTDMKRVGIFGHSMGGHGALTIAFKNPELFKSVSAFSPICAPTKAPWGENAFTRYLGEDTSHWQDYDACDLVRTKGWSSDILVDQGDDDEYLTDYLKPDLLEQACEEKGISIKLRRHAGYDHSYFFVSTFIGDHILWHSERL